MEHPFSVWHLSVPNLTRKSVYFAVLSNPIESFHNDTASALTTNLTRLKPAKSNTKRSLSAPKCYLFHYWTPANRQTYQAAYCRLCSGDKSPDDVSLHPTERTDQEEAILKADVGRFPQSCLKTIKYMFDVNESIRIWLNAFARSYQNK